MHPCIYSLIRSWLNCYYNNVINIACIDNLIFGMKYSYIYLVDFCNSKISLC